MEIQSLEFGLFSLAALAAWHLVELRSWRIGVLALSSAFFVSTHLREPRHASALAILLAAVFLAARAGQRGRLSREGVLLCVGGLLAVFAMNKGLLFPEVFGPVDPSTWAVVVGLSLVLLKAIHVVVDASQGQLRPLRPMTFLVYMTAWFVWLAGPLPRYNDFAEQLEEGLLTPAPRHVLPALNRIVNGCLKLFVACPFLLPFLGAERLSGAEGSPGFWLAFLVFFFGYYVYLYLNFSGYCDVAIALGLLCGLRVPENFDRPWLARNLLEYWHRWHVTLSEWLRDYLFTPVYLAVVARTGRRSWAVPATAAYLTTFLATGLWHGVTWNFFLFGMTHAVGCLALRYGQALAPKALLAWQRRSLVARWGGCALTNAWVALSLLFFAWPLADLRRVFALVLERLS